MRNFMDSPDEPFIASKVNNPGPAVSLATNLFASTRSPVASQMRAAAISMVDDLGCAVRLTMRLTPPTTDENKQGYN